ncbi:MAG: hypothetical protein BI182_02085 [Acetobacterium sp. MES1]|uniref:hypothetical protein n=1 Tax=Acetobacterium sp. MES1 TaxID=1899015 RepID=UPI000B9CAEA8|nr:hypothetical protein [Acetobacterium sp. MES1]OXS26521.1 MAG: hypothetical protein BI182_02085 [Acetobacterium sp. MES1]
MSIKTIKAEITELKARIWRHRQYLAHTQKQLALIYRATPAPAHRSRTRLQTLRAAIDRDSRRLEGLYQALITAIDSQPTPQIKELLTRRYINDQPFAEIADAMGYDLRWVYRLHARGLGLAKRIKNNSEP